MKKVFKQGFRESPLQSTLFGDMAPPETKKLERCFKCGKKLADEGVCYSLTMKGKTNPYCQPCAKEILRPQEEVAEL